MFSCCYVRRACAFWPLLAGWGDPERPSLSAARVASALMPADSLPRRTLPSSSCPHMPTQTEREKEREREMERRVLKMYISIPYYHYWARMRGCLHSVWSHHSRQNIIHVWTETLLLCPRSITGSKTRSSFLCVRSQQHTVAYWPVNTVNLCITTIMNQVLQATVSQADTIHLPHSFQTDSA